MLTDFYNIWHTLFRVNVQHHKHYLSIPSHLRTLAVQPWETLDVARIRTSKVTRECTKTYALSLPGCTSLIFVNSGTKIDGCYNRDIVLMQQMLPSIRSIAYDAYVFQQDSVPAHPARQTVELIQRETPKFIVPELWPQTVLILTPYCRI